MTRELVKSIRLAQRRVEEVTAAIHDPGKIRGLPGTLTIGNSTAGEHIPHRYSERVSADERQRPTVPGLTIHQWQEKVSGNISHMSAHFDADHPFVSTVKLTASPGSATEVELSLHPNTPAPNIGSIHLALGKIGYELRHGKDNPRSIRWNILYKGQKVGHIEFGNQIRTDIHLHERHAQKLIRCLFRNLDAPRQVQYLKGKPERRPDVPRVVRFLRRK
ncbi:hypothetical protein HYV43_01930 [Candidatus Micrarchaeota archaeon]|nr:hypothetical protein [Candidatus Micrarchaeota archaeon]